jgi:HK97 family phage prohead protease
MSDNAQHKNERRYLSMAQFRELVKTTPKDQPLDMAGYCVLAPHAPKLRAVGSENSRMIEFIVSTGDVDRENDTINPEGWDLKDYKKNPVVLWVHDHWSPPIGKALSIYLDGDALVSMCEFTPEDLNPFGYQIYRLYAGGFMHACSAGFQPIEYMYDETRKYGVNYNKQSLLEYSGVPVPANPNALAIARSKGYGTNLLADWASRALDEKTTNDDARRRLEVLRSLSTPDGRALILEIGGLKMTGTSGDKTDKTEKADKTETPDPGVTKVERFKCAAEHEHDSEADAKSCNNFDTIVGGVATAAEGLVKVIKGRKAITKQGRVLSAANEERIRSAVTSLTEVLSQLEVVVDEATEEDAADDNKDASGVLMVTASPEDALAKSTEGTPKEIALVLPDGFDLEAAISKGVTGAINAARGRLD